jgi:hypothetical protein
LVDIFVRTSLAWASLGLEAHMLDTMARTLDDDNFWRPQRHLGGPHLAPTSPTLSFRGQNVTFGRLDVTLGLGFVVVLIDGHLAHFGIKKAWFERNPSA